MANCPDAGYPNGQLSGRWLSEWPIVRTLVIRMANYPDHLGPSGKHFLTAVVLHFVGRDSSVGIPAGYKTDGPGIESLWGARFSAPVQTGREAHPVSYTIGTRSFPGVKRSGRGVDHPPLSIAEVKERIQLYLYSPSGPSWPVIGWLLPLP
jgi:hypothetical protein